MRRLSITREDEIPRLRDANQRWRFATEASLAEIHRVLKPGGTLGMIWNVEDCKLSFGFLSR